LKSTPAHERQKNGNVIKKGRTIAQGAYTSKRRRDDIGGQYNRSGL
jgi:hypothetical protein